jgi:inner membrane protease ATP23
MASNASTSTPSETSPEDTRTFDRWRKTFGVITGLGLSETERAREMELHHARTCEDWKKHLMNYSQYHQCVLYFFHVLACLSYFRC